MRTLILSPTLAARKTDMIISRRPAASIYSVDPIAHSVRSSLSPWVRIDSRPQPQPARAKLDVAYLYPSLFADAKAPARTAKKAA
jgi:hypothetical protein